MLNATWRLVIMFIASQRKPHVPATATNSPSVTNKIPIHFHEISPHKHSETWGYCENLKNVHDEVEVQICTNIFHWKAHSIRSVNQEAAKQDQLKMIAYNPESALLVMDWAMKFQQLRYREKQSDWFGKRGLSWHISTVICSDPENPGSLDYSLMLTSLMLVSRTGLPSVQLLSTLYKKSRGRSHMFLGSI